MKKLFIWDIDGTLIDCGASGKQALESSFKSSYSINNALMDINLAGKLDYNIINAVIEKNDINDFEWNDFLKIYTNKLKENLLYNKKFKTLDNIVKNLKSIDKNEKLINAIATGNSEVGAIVKLKNANLLKYFRILSCGDSFETRKRLVQNAINISQARVDNKIYKENIYMIGDTPDDIIAGKDNNIKTIAVASGSYSKDILRKYKPDFLFDKLPSDLIKTISGGDNGKKD
ncbi:MAG: HAD family hydrolase [Bacillota bacterium]